MVERFIAPVLKTGDPKGSVGSNPTPSVYGCRFRVHSSRFIGHSLPIRRIPLSSLRSSTRCTPPANVRHLPGSARSSVPALRVRCDLCARLLSWSGGLRSAIPNGVSSRAGCRALAYRNRKQNPRFGEALTVALDRDTASYSRQFTSRSKQP
jgi:hypothetical protein